MFGIFPVAPACLLVCFPCTFSLVAPCSMYCIHVWHPPHRKAPHPKNLPHPNTSTPAHYQHLHTSSTCTPKNFHTCTQTLRESIALHNGYEVATQGDSFFVVFPRVADAVQWAMSVQWRLLQTNWPKAVYRLPACHKVCVVCGGVGGGEGGVRGGGLLWGCVGAVIQSIQPCTQVY